MKYYFNVSFGMADFEETIDSVIHGLKEEGFGIITDIDMQGTLKKKIDVDINKYRILGACNPGLAYNALQHEERIGLMLPCNVIVFENENEEVEAAIIDPIASMMAIENEDLGGVASKVQEKLKIVADNLSKSNVGV